MTINLLGIDIAKSTFQLHGADNSGNAVHKRRLSRRELAAHEQSHEATRVRERGMRRFKSIAQAQRFVTVHAAVANLFNLDRHLVRAQHYRDLRTSAFGEWGRAVA